MLAQHAVEVAGAFNFLAIERHQLVASVNTRLVQARANLGVVGHQAAAIRVKFDLVRQRRAQRPGRNHRQAGYQQVLAEARQLTAVHVLAEEPARESGVLAYLAQHALHIFHGVGGGGSVIALLLTVLLPQGLHQFVERRAVVLAQLQVEHQGQPRALVVV